MSHPSLAAAFFTLAASAWAQVVIPNPFTPALPQLTNYLQLTSAQVQAILANNNEYNRWSAEKQARIYQVQREIADETAREPLDPAALGIRYAEIEAICREMRDQAARYQKKNTDVLTDAQKPKLKALDDALKLMPVIAEAQSGNLMGSGSTPGYFTSSGSLLSLVGGTIAAANGCTYLVPSAAIRAGNFSGEVPPPASAP